MEAGAPQNDQVAPNNDEVERERRFIKLALLYMQTVSLVEALCESFPQLVLQIRVGFFYGDLAEWVFFLAASLSLTSVLKAVGTFVWNFYSIVDVLETLKWVNVASFQVRETSNPLQAGDQWHEATPAEVRSNKAKLEEALWDNPYYICTLTKGMEVGGQAYGYRVWKKSTIGGGHKLYAQRG